MKNLLLTLALLISSIAFAQKPVMDSIQVFEYAEKPELVVTLYNYDTLFTNLTKISDATGQMSFVCVFYYKETEDGPQKTHTQSFSRNKPK